MQPEDSVSIIVCTCNRAESLQRTLESLAQLGRPPAGPKAEIIVVDNAGSDDTAAVVKGAAANGMGLRYVREPKRGLSHARNTGLAEAEGDLILFTDDDVRVAENWLEQMTQPLRTGRYDAVTGRVILPQPLRRPWMNSMHQAWLAVNDDTPKLEGAVVLVGANMGFRRSVLERVPAFDPELGAGALGFAEETLFGRQLGEAGFKVGYVPEAQVVHHLDPSRFRRANWLEHARKLGRSEAYLRYHWEHVDFRHPTVASLAYWMRLKLRRLLQPPLNLDSEGCADWELSYVMHLEAARHFLVERRRPRNYARRGLTRCHPVAGSPVPVPVPVAVGDRV